jgi:hypothetical protein
MLLLLAGCVPSFRTVDGQLAPRRPASASLMAVSGTGDHVAGPLDTDGSFALSLPAGETWIIHVVADHGGRPGIVATFSRGGSKLLVRTQVTIDAVHLGKVGASVAEISTQTMANDCTDPGTPLEVELADAVDSQLEQQDASDDVCSDDSGDEGDPG